MPSINEMRAASAPNPKPEVTILEHKIVALKECMRMSADELENCIKAHEPPNVPLLTVINRLRDWSR